MNEIVNKFLLTGNKMPEMHLKQPGFTYSGCISFTKNKNLCKHEIQITFIRMIWMNLVFGMIWIMVNIKI